MFALKNLQLHGMAKLFERTARRVVGQHNRLVGVENLRGLRHKIDTRKRDYVGGSFLCLARKPERIADIIGNRLNFLADIVVRKNHGIALLLQLENLFLRVRKRFFFAVFVGREDDCLHCLIKN